MSRSLPPTDAEKTALARLGLSKEPGRAAPYLRAILTFVKVSSEEQLKQIPFVGPLLLGAGEALKELSEEQDDQKLEQRIESLLSVGEQSQEDIKLLTGLAGLIFAQQQQLISQLQTAGLATDRKQLAEFATGAALVAYRSRVARDYQYVDNRGIEGMTRKEHAASLPLEDIYIVPRLMPERERENFREREKDVLKKLLDDRGDLTNDQRVRLEEEFAVMTGERWRPGAKVQDEGLALGRALEQARHAVIIGGPGVGKSVLTRYLARICALGEYAMETRLGWREQLTPVVIPLAAFADARSKRPDLKLRAFLDEKMTERGGEALRVVIADELDKGRAYVILDGVDEVPDSHTRAAVVQAVDEFILDHADNRVLVTSRPYGYVRLAGDPTHFQLLNFSPAQVEAFVRRWQRAFEKRQHPDAPDYEDADEQADALVNEIRRSPKVTELATNPLMLVIISLIRYEKARLPEERVQLYNRAVNTLMDTWNQWRSLQAKELGGAMLPLDRLIRVWGAVAEWMRREKPTGVVHRAELKRELVRVLVEKEYDEDTPEATAEAYLRAAADRAGLLEERGFEIFGFWHPTFEEFLATVELTTPTGRAVERLLPLRDDPRWREVILLAVGYVGIVQRDNETATQLVEALAFRDTPPVEPVTHPCLRLAAACVADDVGVKRTLSQRVIVELANIIRAQPYSQLILVFTNTVRALPKLRAKPETISALAPLVEYHDWEVRMEAARIFSNVTSENAEALALCERLLEDTDSDVRCHAALGLARVGDNRPEVWLALLKFHGYGAYIKPAFREFLVANSGVAKAAWTPLLDSKEAEMRRSAAMALYEIRQSSNKALKVLVADLNASDPQLRLKAAMSLLWLNNMDERAIATLSSLVTAAIADDDSYAGLSALGALLRVPKHEKIVDTAASWLNFADLELRYYAAEYLMKIGRTDDETIAPLLSQLTVDDPYQRLKAAITSRWMGRETEDVFEALASCLIAEDITVLFQAAQAIYEMGRADNRVAHALTALLNSEDPEIKFEAARLLRKMGQEDDNVVTALFSIAANNDSYFRTSAVQELAEMGRADDRLVSMLHSQVTAGESTSRFEAANLLKAAGRGDVALETIAKMADAQPWVALGACQKVLKHEKLSLADGEALAEIVSMREGDSSERRKARAWLFDWLWGMIEPQERAAA
jgi:HEAT repeat protein